MKVIQLINGMTTGGAETLVKDYVLHFPKEVESLVVMTDPFRGGPNELAIASAGVRLQSIPDRLGWCGKRRSLPVRAVRAALSKTMYIREFQRILREEKPDCVHAHLNTLYLLAASWKELKAVRLVFTCHTAADVAFGPDRKEQRRCAEKLTALGKLKIIALHEDMARKLDARFGPGTSLVVNNCIDLQRFREPKVSREEMRRQLGIPQDAFVIGHVGRFVPSKNHGFLVEILKELRGKGINAFLLMVGSGVNQELIREKLRAGDLQECSLILQNRGDVPELLGAMDVFVFPSLYEGFGNVALEAQAAGRKCVISDCVPSMVAVTGLAVMESLERSAAHWCDTILSDRGREAGSLEKLEKYDIQAVVDRLVEIYGGNDV